MARGCVINFRIASAGVALYGAGLSGGGYPAGRSAAEFISENPQDLETSRDSLFLFKSFPGRLFTAIYPSETPQERLTVSEG